VGKPIGRSPAPHPFEDECCWPGCDSPPHTELPLCGRHIADVALVADRSIEAFLAGLAGERTPPRQMKADPVVYYVQLAPGIVKIGTTVDLRRRLVGLRVDPDAVLVTEPGGEPLERMRHAQFAHLWIGRRENFRAEADLLSHVEMLQAHLAC
jgi:hypothetical protein